MLTLHQSLAFIRFMFYHSFFRFHALPNILSLSYSRLHNLFVILSLSCSPLWPTYSRFRTLAYITSLSYSRVLALAFILSRWYSSVHKLLPIISLSYFHLQLRVHTRLFGRNFMKTWMMSITFVDRKTKCRKICNYHDIKIRIICYKLSAKLCANCIYET